MEWEQETRIVYRCYATLYFVFVVDGSESELGVLDLIQASYYYYYLYMAWIDLRHGIDRYLSNLLIGHLRMYASSTWSFITTMYESTLLALHSCLIPNLSLV